MRLDRCDDRRVCALSYAVAFICHDSVVMSDKTTSSEMNQRWGRLHALVIDVLINLVNEVV